MNDSRESTRAKRINKMVLREGFWRSDTEPHLPRVRARTRRWLGRKAFLKALDAVEQALANKTHGMHVATSKGESKCRICDENNGNETFTVTRFSIVFQWPSGFAHYVREHNVRPSLAFEEFILNVASQL